MLSLFLQAHDDIVGRAAGREHRQNHLVLVDEHLDNGGATEPYRLAEGGTEAVGIGCAIAYLAKGIGQLKKVGLSVEYRVRVDRDCHWRTIPSTPLLNSTVTTGMP